MTLVLFGARFHFQTPYDSRKQGGWERQPIMFSSQVGLRGMKISGASGGVEL
jgi:hypothetical protein